MKIDKKTQKQVDLVVGTLGPKGRLVTIDYKNNEAVCTKDGFSVAYKIQDPTHMFKLLRQASKKQVEETGDSSTSVMLLASEMVKRLDRKDLPKLKDLIGWITATIDAEKMPVDVEKDLFNVAMIPANSDREIAEPITEAIKHNGVDGHYIIEEKFDAGIEYEQLTGYYLNLGMSDPFFANTATGSCVFSDPVFFIKDQITLSELSIPASQAAQQHKPLVVIGSCSEECVDAMKQNQLKGIGSYVHIDTTYFPQNKKADLFLDLQTLSSCVTKIDIRRHATLIEFKKTKELSAYIQRLKKSDKNSGEEKNQVKERVARFESKICKIKVGSDSVAGLSEKKDHVEDTILSTLSALREGYVPGAGYELYRISKELPWKYRKIFSSVWRKVGRIIPDDTIIDSAACIKSQIKNAFEVASLILNSQKDYISVEK